MSGQNPAPVEPISTWPRLVIDEMTTWQEVRDFLDEVEAVWWADREARNANGGVSTT